MNPNTSGSPGAHLSLTYIFQSGTNWTPQNLEEQCKSRGNGSGEMTLRNTQQGSLRTAVCPPRSSQLSLPVLHPLDGCCLPAAPGLALICLLFPHSPQRKPGSWPRIPWTPPPRRAGEGKDSTASASPSVLPLAVLFSAPCANSSGARALAFPARCSGQLGRQALCSGSHALRCRVRGCPARLRAPRLLLAVPPAPRRAAQAGE